MTNFDWQMEDDAEWPAETSENKAKKKRPSILFPLLIILAIGLAGGGIYSLVNRQLEGAGREIKADVRRTHELVLAAADSGDVELFTTFLSGINANWLEVQRESVKRERFDEAPLLGLELAERPIQIDDVTLNTTLDEATITYTRWYSDSSSAIGVIALQQISVYRRGEDRWLLAPPTADFWGEERSFRKEQLTFIYPERDEQQALELAEKIARMVPEICEQLATGECPPDWHLNLKLSTDPQTILSLNAIEGEVEDLSINLPTPSLLGLAFDDAGLEAVFQGYQQLIERRVAAAFTLYLTNNPALVPPLLLVRSATGEFLEAEPSDIFPDADLTFSCRTASNGQQGWTVFRYSLRSGDWNQVFQREYVGGDSGYIIPLEGSADSYVIQEYLRDDLLTARLLLWQDGQTMVISEQMVNFDSALAAPFFMRKMDPSGRYLLIGKAVDINNSWYLLDRQMCQASGDCTMEPVINEPIWSPDGSQMLMQEPQVGNQTRNYRTLYLAEGLGQEPVEIGQGAAPFWLNETTFGYNRLTPDGQVELVLTEGENSWTVLETADLEALVTEQRKWNRMTIWDTWANSEGTMLALMTTPDSTQNSGPFDIFLVEGNLNDGNEIQTSWLFSSDFPVNQSYFSGSPDNEIVMFTQRGTPLYFQDLETDTAVPFDMSLGWVVDWSPDGRFYIQWADEGMTLTDPATGFQAQLVYDISTCLGLEWFEN